MSARDAGFEVKELESNYWGKASTLWDKRAEIFDKSVVQGELGNRTLLEGWKNLIQKMLASNGGKIQRILDVGTGSGFLAIALAELGHEVSGVDISPVMLRIAAEHAAERGLQIDFQVSDALDLSKFSPNTFDVVITRYLTWALPDLMRAYEEWWRVLRFGGRLIVIDGDWFKNRQLLFRKIWRYLAWALIYLTERRKPERRKKEELISLELPVARMMRPEEDIRILESLGYKLLSLNLDIYPIVYRGLRGKFEYLKRCYWGSAFMIVTEKNREGAGKI